MRPLPGSAPVRWRESPYLWAPVAWLAALAWPPIILTLFIFPPQAVDVGLDMDWRLLSLAGAALGVALGLELLRREWLRGRTPATRLAVIWRFTLYGAIFAVALQIVVTLALMVIGWFSTSGVAQGVGVAETTFLIYGVGMLPLTAVVGAAYAVWAGLMVALIAFAPTPPPLRTPPHLLGPIGDLPTDGD